MKGKAEKHEVVSTPARGVNPQSWYTDESVATVIRCHLAQSERSKSDKSYLLEGHVVEDKHPYRVMILPAVDTQGMGLPITYFLDKHLQPKNQLAELLKSVIEGLFPITDFDGVHEALKALLKPHTEDPDTVLLVFNELKQCEYNQARLAQRMQALAESTHHSRKEVFDEIKGKWLATKRAFDLKILFPYNITLLHWLTGEILISKPARSDVFHIQVQVHDPMGGGQMEPAAYEQIIDILMNRIRALNPKATFKHECSESPYPRRQGEGDGSSCGVIVCEDLIKRSNGQLLTMESPYPVGAKVLREAQLALVKAHGSEADQRYFARHCHQATHFLKEEQPHETESDELGNTPLHWAAAQGELALVQALHQQEDHYVDELNARGRAPLHIAALCNHGLIVHYLLSQNAQIDRPDADGMTPIHMAARAGATATVQVLIEHGASLLIENKQGLRPLHTAVIYNRVSVISVLCEHSPDPVNVDILDPFDQTPMHFAAQLGRTACLRYLHLQGANPDARDNKGRTPLHHAAKAGQVEACKWLINLDVSIDLQDNKGETPDALAKRYAERPGNQRKVISVFKNERLPGRVQRKRITRKADQPFAHIRNLVFQGGGVKGIAYLGTLNDLSERGLALTQIERVGGASAGAITALLLALNYDLPALHEEMQGLDFKQFVDGQIGDQSTFDFLEKELKVKLTAIFDDRIKEEMSKLLKRLQSQPKSLFGNISKYWGLFWQGKQVKEELTPQINLLQTLLAHLSEHKGLCPGNFFLEWADAHIRAKTKSTKNPKGIRWATFKELHDLKVEHGFKDLYVVGVNVNTARTEVFSYETTPDVVVADAVRVSMSIPLLFEPYQVREKHGKHAKPIPHPDQAYYIDGGTSDNFPDWLFDRVKYRQDSQGMFESPKAARIGYEDQAQAEQELYVYNDETLGLRLVSLEERDEFTGDARPVVAPINGFWSYVMGVIKVFYDKQSSDHQRTKSHQRVIYIDTLNVGTADFGLHAETKRGLQYAGRAAVTQFLRRASAVTEPVQLSAPVLAEMIRYVDTDRSQLMPTSRGLRMDSALPLSFGTQALYNLLKGATEHDIAALQRLRVRFGTADAEGNTVLHYACREANIKVLEIIRAHELLKLTVRNQAGETGLDCLLALIAGAEAPDKRRGANRLVIELLKSGVYACQAPDRVRAICAPVLELVADTTLESQLVAFNAYHAQAMAAGKGEVGEDTQDTPTVKRQSYYKPERQQVLEEAIAYKGPIGLPDAKDRLQAYRRSSQLPLSPEEQARQNEFVSACAQGNLAQMQQLRKQGAELDVANEQGQYPLLSCLESLKMDAIKWLGTQIEGDGNEAWKRIQLEDLEQRLNRQKPSALKKSYEYLGTMYPTWGELDEWYRTNELTAKGAYDRRYGDGMYLQDLNAMTQPAFRLLFVGSRYRRASIWSSADGLVRHVNVAINTVLDYARQSKTQGVEATIGP